MLGERRKVRKRGFPSSPPPAKSRRRTSDHVPIETFSKPKFSDKKKEERARDDWDDDDREISYYDFEGGMDHTFFGFMEVTPCSNPNSPKATWGPSPIPHSPKPDSPQPHKKAKCSRNSRRPKDKFPEPSMIPSPLSSPSLSPCSNSLFLGEEIVDEIVDTLQSPGVIPETQEPLKEGKSTSFFDLVAARPRAITPNALEDLGNSSFIPATPDPELERGKDNADDLPNLPEPISQNHPLSQCSSEESFHGSSFAHTSPHTPPEHYSELRSTEDPSAFYAGLPVELVETYSKLEVRRPYEWQVNCLSSIKRDFPRNFLFTVPTSGGKNLIAEVCLLRCSFLEKKKGLYILPSVSLVIEKVEQLSQLAKATKARALAYYGSQGRIPLPSGNQIIVTTFERANGIVNSLIVEKRMNEVGTVIVDELHMLEEGSRGVSLELLLTKIQAVSQQTIQIIGMSATIPNLPDLANWLTAKWEIARGRPIPLVEMILIDNQLYDRTGVPLRSIPQPAQKDEKHSLLFLTQEVIDQGHAVLIFSPTKSLARGTAIYLAEHLDLVGRSDELKSRQSTLSLDLKGIGAKCNNLREITTKGVAYHHSGLTSEERDIVEKGFRKQVLQILCTTTSLAAGVNLPCRRVIIRAPRIGNYPLGNRQYRQIVGRAGRVGIDASGDAILITSSREGPEAYRLINQPLPPVESALHTFVNDKHDLPLLRLVLDAVVGLGARTYQEIEQYFDSTLFAYQQKANNGSIFRNGGKMRAKHLQAALDYLIQPPMYMFHSTFFETNRPICFLEKRRPENSSAESFEDIYEDECDDFSHLMGSPKIMEVGNFEWVPSSLGEATYLSSLAPEETLFVYRELKRALDEGLILSHDLHACYLLCPLKIESAIPWEKFLQIYNGAPQTVQNLAELICAGSTSSFETQTFERFVRAKAQQNTSWLKKTSEETRIRSVRLFWAWILVEFISETDPGSLAAKYALDRGNVESVKLQAATFSFQVTNFAKRLGWHSFSDSLTTISKRLDFGGKEDILELCEIKGLRAQRARALHTAGFTAPEKILRSTPEKIHGQLDSVGLGGTFGLDERMQKKNIEVVLEHVQQHQLKRANSLMEEARSLATWAGEPKLFPFS